jgi:NADPH-dependent ferric siderophore reductase
VHTVTVARTQWLTPTMVRVVLTGTVVRDFPALGFTDTYVKLKFGDSLRAYTVRSVDRAAGELAIDFVVHGDEGLAGPWAANAQPGDSIGFVGPGGEWAPSPDAASHLFVGDEAALPVIAASLEALLASNPNAHALVFAEVGVAGEEYPVPTGPTVGVEWVHRDGAPYGERLVAAVLAADFPTGEVHAFVHGNADMVRPLRRYLLRDRGLERSRVSISGYWRAGHTDEAWRAVKKDFNALMESETDR